MTGLSDRILKDDKDIALAKKKIDFHVVNQIIARKRQESLRILKDEIED